MKINIIGSLLSMLCIALIATACTEDAPSEPTAETEVFECVSTLNGSTTHSGAAFVIATVRTSQSAGVNNGFVIVGYASTDIDPKTRLDDGIQIFLRSTEVGSYPVQYLTGATFMISHGGIAYVALQGTVTISRFDAVGGYVEGTFEGTANSQDGTKTITVKNGRFKVKRDADGLYG